MLAEADQRILAYMQRARTGHYTTAQLVRTTKIPLAEVQRRLAGLEREGYLIRSQATSYPAFQLTDQGFMVPITRSRHHQD